MYLSHRRGEIYRALTNFRSPQYPWIKINDPFLATAVLQKSLRRGDDFYAQNAARALLQIDPPRLWRRLVIAACEDFGLSNLDLTAQIIAASSDKGWRSRAGGDELVLSYLVAQLVGVPRDRRIDETYMLAVSLSRIERLEISIEIPGASRRVVGLLQRAVNLVLQCEKIVPYRGIRSIISTECDVAIARMTGRGLTDRGLEEACMQARRTSQCLLPVLLPLLRAATEDVGADFKAVTHIAPEVRDFDGIPSYAVDGFTRPGRAALASLSRQDRNLARFLAPLPSAKARMTALANMCFAVEGGICTLEVSDPLYDEIKKHSLGCWAGLPETALGEGLAIMRDAIPALNEIRSELVCANRN